MNYRRLRKHKNLILHSSIIFAILVVILSAASGRSVIMVIGLAYLLFMVINNWTYIVGSKDEVDEMVEEARIFHLRGFK